MKIKRFTLLIVIILSFLATHFSGDMYVRIFGPQGSGFWGPSHPEYFMGFLMNIILFGSFFSWLFYNKWKNLSHYVLPVLFFYLFVQAWEELIIATGLVVSGLVLAQVSLFIKSKIIKIKSEESPVIVKSAPLITQEVFSNKLRILLIIYLLIDFFTGLLFGFYAGKSIISITIRIISLIIIIIAIYFIAKRREDSYRYIGLYAVLSAILQFFGAMDILALIMYIVLALFSMFKLYIIKPLRDRKKYADLDHTLTNIMIFILALSLLFKFPVFLLVLLSIIDMFGESFAPKLY